MGAARPAWADALTVDDVDALLPVATVGTKRAAAYQWMRKCNTVEDQAVTSLKSR